MDKYESTPLHNAPYLPLIDCSQPKQRQTISRRKVAGWCFYISLNAVLLYVIYEGFVMRGVL